MNDIVVIIANIISDTERRSKVMQQLILIHSKIPRHHAIVIGHDSERVGPAKRRFAQSHPPQYTYLIWRWPAINSRQITLDQASGGCYGLLVKFMICLYGHLPTEEWQKYGLSRGSQLFAMNKLWPVTDTTTIVEDHDRLGNYNFRWLRALNIKLN